MFKGNRKYVFVLALCFIGLIALQILAPKPINWRLSYAKKDKIPFGTSALYSMLPEMFPEEISNSTVPIYNLLKENSSLNTSYVIINQNFKIDTLDMRELFNFVKRGNSVFIAANYFGGKFADSLKLHTDDLMDFGNDIANDSAALANIYHQHADGPINFTNQKLKRKNGYLYTKGFEDSYFTSFDTSRFEVLGENDQKKPDFISMKMGAGRIYLSAVPEVFSNYLFINEINYDYAYKALSYLPPQPLIWDEYYKLGNKTVESPLHVLFENPALSTAYYLLILSLLTFMLLGIKRKQRIIPVIEPLRNTTLQFVDIVGTLYYQTGNHKNIADKKIMYFLEYIRTAFQVKTTIYDDVFINRITSVSGIDRQKVHDLFYYFSDLSLKQSISQQELLKLNKMIEEFHKLNKR